MSTPTQRWLLLRGLVREARHWGAFPRAFEAGIPGARTHTLDLPGTGAEHARPSPASIAGIVADLRARWLPLREAHEGPWRLLAISLGGMVASSWCATHPEDFARVVIIASSAGNVSPPHHRMRLPVLHRVLGTAFADPLARERTILDVTTTTRRGDEALASTWAGYAREAPVRVPVALSQLAAASRFRAPERLPVPSLVLVGDGDRLVEPECSRRLARRWGSALEVHPDGGHDLSTDAPTWVVEQVGRWLATGEGAR
jgi:pimeloyl-ACP methyl ester carboxylesterase